MTKPDGLTDAIKWSLLVNGPSFGKQLTGDDEVVRLAMWRILKTGGSSESILADLRGLLEVEVDREPLTEDEERSLKIGNQIQAMLADYGLDIGVIE